MKKLKHSILLYETQEDVTNQFNNICFIRELDRFEELFIIFEQAEQKYQIPLNLVLDTICANAPCFTFDFKDKKYLVVFAIVEEENPSGLTAEEVEQIMNYDAEKENVKRFKVAYEKEDYDSNIFTCVLCGEKTSLNDGASKNGHRFVCNHCLDYRLKNREEQYNFIWRGK